MIKNIILCPDRVRKINGSFAFIEHRFLRDGFWHQLNHTSLILYIFLILVSDRQGLSWYGYDKICTMLKITLDEYIDARDNLIQNDLIGFENGLFQVLSLPERAHKQVTPKSEMSYSQTTSKPQSLGNVLSRIMRNAND